MAITTKKQGVWELNEVYEKIDQGDIWTYNANDPGAAGQLWAFGKNSQGQLGLNTPTDGNSSPVQIGSGTTWTLQGPGYADTKASFALKTDGTLWGWGQSPGGNIANVNIAHPAQRSSPTQIPGTTWDTIAQGQQNACLGRKSDGSLWGWGISYQGEIGNNQNGGAGPGQYRWSSPVQIPGTNWSKQFNVVGQSVGAIKSNGTLWMWANNGNGQLGQNNRTPYSSPTQVPGTDWNRLGKGGDNGETYCIKNDGTMWAWGANNAGQMGQNQKGPVLSGFSSPTQIGTDTSWLNAAYGQSTVIATKSDGSMWAWGDSNFGALGNNKSSASQSGVSSPVRIGTETNWHPHQFVAQKYGFTALKTDGSLWTWGNNDDGQLGKNSPAPTDVSSPTQVPGTYSSVGGFGNGFLVVRPV